MDIGIIWKGMGICFVCRFILLASQNPRSFQAPSYQCQKICSYRIEWCIMFLPGVESSPFVSWESLDKVSREVVIEFALSGRLLRSRVRRLSLLLHLKKHKLENQSKKRHFFGLVMSVGKQKFWCSMSIWTSDLWNLHSDTLPLSCRDSTVTWFITMVIYDMPPANCWDQ